MKDRDTIITDSRSVKVFDTYPGGKGGDGVYQFIINHIPAHTYYMEPFLGSGAIFLKKKPAKYSFLGDKDDDVIDEWYQHSWGDYWERVIFIKDSFYKTFNTYSNYPGSHPSDFFIYLDPPYPESVRRSKKSIYRKEMKTDSEHLLLLTHVTDSGYHFPTMISSYPNELYDRYLKDWYRVEFNARTRNGNATEVLWMNYDISTLPLHDYSYLGENNKERERIRLKSRRWVEGLERLPAREREAILVSIKSQFNL